MRHAAQTYWLIYKTNTNHSFWNNRPNRWY